MDKIAVLIPCYNEAKTIEKVVKDYQKVMYMTIIQKIIRMSLRKRQEPLCITNIAKEKEM